MTLLPTSFQKLSSRAHLLPSFLSSPSRAKQRSVSFPSVPKPRYVAEPDFSGFLQYLNPGGSPKDRVALQSASSGFSPPFLFQPFIPDQPPSFSHQRRRRAGSSPSSHQVSDLRRNGWLDWNLYRDDCESQVRQLPSSSSCFVPAQAHRGRVLP